MEGDSGENEDSEWNENIMKMTGMSSTKCNQKLIPQFGCYMWSRVKLSRLISTLKQKLSKIMSTTLTVPYTYDATAVWFTVKHTSAHDNYQIFISLSNFALCEP